MARTHGKNVDFSFDSVALEDELKQVTMNFDVPEAEITAFSDAWQNFIAGKPTATLDVEGSYDPAAGAGDITIFNELGLEGEEYDFEPDGSTGYNGFGIITRYSISAPVNGPITYSLAVRHNGGSAAADGAAPTRA
jgi:predicted secreted protein